MKPYIYILNCAGCHGHYLQFLLDKFSKKTPIINNLPFNWLGNSHNALKYSGFVEYVDHHTLIDPKNFVNTNIIQMSYENQILYHERTAMARAGDAGRDLDNVHKDISFFKKYNPTFYNKIQKLYSIKKDNIPKWLLRDAYKLGFLDWNNQGSVVQSKNEKQWVKENLEKNNSVRFLDVGAFFNLKELKTQLIKLDNIFNLDLDLEGLDEIHKIFTEKNKILQTQKNTDFVLNSIENNSYVDIPNLDIIQQAYVYAKIEKKYDFVQMPLTENFFTNTKELIQYINFYPEHYKAMNPNLPKYKNIDNPFFLHRQKTK